MLSYIITERTITVLLNGIPKVIDNSHKNFALVADGIKKGLSESRIQELIDTGKALETYSDGKVKVENGVVYYKDKAIKNTLTNRIITMMEEGFNVNGMCLFMENLYSNPSKTAVDELYLFLEACNLPITEDGCFLAYKKVREDYKDIYSGTFDNSIGKICEMERNEVDDNRNNTCSAGLHFASYSYMKSYGNTGGSDRIVIVKINPADVVSIPSDYNNAKGRTWRYEVVNEVANDGITQIKDDCISDEDTYTDSYYENDDAETYNGIEDTVQPMTLKEKAVIPERPYSGVTSVSDKEIKDLIVKNLYGGTLDIGDLFDALQEVSEEMYDYISEEQDYNEYNVDFDDVYSEIEDRITAVKFENVQEEFDYGVGFGYGSLSDIKEMRIKEYISKFGGKYEDLINYANVDLRNAVESGTPITVKETAIPLDITVEDAIEKIDEIVTNLKNGKISWNWVIGLVPKHITREMVDYNEYNKARQILIKCYLAGEFRL